MKQVLLEVVKEHSTGGVAHFQMNIILSEATERLKITSADLDRQQELLTLWHDLFRDGLLSPGWNLDMPDLPFCHITSLGHETLQKL